MINRITPLILFIGLAHWSCEDETELLTDCPENEICGCTNSSATNFDDTATFDDGSCEYIVGDVQAKWLYTYNLGPGGGQVHCVRQTSDGGLILAGSENYKGMLLKTDEEGILEWGQTYEIGDSEVLKSVSQCSDGGFIATGLFTGTFPDLEYLWIIKTDETGNVEWQETVGTADENDWGEDVIETQDGGFVITGTQDDDGFNSKAFLRKYSSSGSLLWNKKYSSSDYNEGISVLETADGNLVFVGLSGTAHGAYKHFMVKADADGNQIWKKRFGDNTQQTLNAVCESADGGYVAAGFCNNYDYNYIVKRSSSGSMEWENCFTSSSGYHFGYNDIISAASGGYYLLDNQYFLTKIDDNGEMPWTVSLRKVNQSIIQLDDGDLVLAGNKSSIWLLRLDPLTIQTSRNAVKDLIIPEQDFSKNKNKF